MNTLSYTLAILQQQKSSSGSAGKMSDNGFVDRPRCILFIVIITIIISRKVID